MSIIVFRCVQRDDLPVRWPEAAEVLAPAIALWRNRHTPASLLAALIDQQLQLWVAILRQAQGEDGRIIAAAVTQVQDWPGGAKECAVVLAAGEGHDLWPEWMADVKAWAAGEDCDLVTAIGRPGWQRVLAPAGFVHDGVALACSLGG